MMAMPAGPRADAARVSLFRRSTIRVRLSLAFSAVALLLVVVAVVGAWQLAELDRVAQSSLRGQRLMGRWAAETQGNAIRTLVLLRTSDAALRQLLMPEVAAASQRITALQKEVEALLATARGKARLQEVGARRKAYLELRQRMLDKQTAGQGEEARAMLETSVVPALAAYTGAIGSLLDYYGGEAGSEAAAARGAVTTGQEVVLGVCALMIAVGFIFSWQITSGIVGPVRFAAKLARRVAGGDLTTSVRTGGGDEIAQMLRALADMQANLHTVVAEVSVGARTVTTRSARLAAGTADLAQRTDDQARTLEDTASAMEALTATVGRNADNARHASHLATGASAVARQGGVVVGEVVATMADISGSSRQIADIVGVIDSIAFQTNILALNAAVEAARAGEQGRGFAVVAAEVRNLAQRSAGAAREIKALIEASAGKVEAGARLVDAAGSTMAQIVASVEEVTGLVTQIATASQEQSAGIAQVNTSVARMEQAVQQNAALVDEATAATEAMKGEASALLQTVSRFSLAEAAAPAPIRVQPAPPAAQLLRALAARGPQTYAGAVGQKES